MCGIFAYFGHQQNPAALVVEGLKKLEYRGYDSWGIAFKNNGAIELNKEVGKIGELSTHDIEKLFPLKKHRKPDLKETHTIAMGHTRWATHGGVTQKNAHPHLSPNKKIAIVHNGIIENYLDLKQKLMKQGHTFTSETDTEVIAHLIEEFMYKNGNIKRDMSFGESVKKTIEQLHGRYAILAISADENTIIAARRGSPLIVGVKNPQKPFGEREYFIASDIPAFLKNTREIMYLDDDQMVVIGSDIHFINLATGQLIEKRIITIDWNEESAEKGNYPHFMIKEITEQKETIMRAINQDEKKLWEVVDAIKEAYGTFLIGCGTAGKVCMAAEYLFAKIAEKHVNVTFGSEFPAYKHFLTDRTLMIAVSQSGETADTLEAIEIAKKIGVKIVSIVNVESSTMARISDIVLPIKAGPEKAVASTKATTSQLAILTLLAYACAGKLDEGKRLLINTGGQINDMLNPRYEDHIQKIAEKMYEVESMYVIGKSVNYPIALESAIKLQEVSYIHAEGFAGGELKHGPIALISNKTPCIVIVSNDETKHEILSNAMEVKSRGGYMIGVSPENSEIFDDWIKVPDAGDASPIVNIIPIQILAYKLAVLRQNNPDMPRNLAKSVTVK